MLPTLFLPQKNHTGDGVGPKRGRKHLDTRQEAETLGQQFPSNSAGVSHPDCSARSLYYLIVNSKCSLYWESFNNQLPFKVWTEHLSQPGHLE